MANVIIITPRSSPSVNYPNTRPPAGPLYLAATLLEAGFSVTLVDETVEPEAREKIAQAIGPDTICVGLSALSGQTLLSCLDLARFIRSIDPGLPIVWGGAHPSIAPESTLAHVLVDAICIGEGEEAFPAMVQAFRDGHGLEDIPSIGFKKDGNPVFTPMRSTHYDLERLPRLPYHLVDLSLYRNTPCDNFFGFRGKRLMTLESSRGCPFKCHYCVQSVKNERFRVMSPSKVLGCLEDMVKAGAEGVTMADDNFFSNHRKAKAVMEAIRDKGWNLEFFIAARADYLNRLDDESFDLMRQIGVKMLGIGVESGSDRMLKSIGKKERIEATYQASRRLARAGIHAYFHFIVGFPGETLDDIGATYEAMGRIMRENPFAKVTNKKLIPLAGTPTFKECVRLGMKEPITLEEWAQTQDLAWEQRTPYVSPKAEEWYQSVKYFDTVANLLSTLRVPCDTAARRKRRRMFIPLFWMASALLGLRRKLGLVGPGPDTRLFPRFTMWWWERVSRIGGA